MMLPTHLLAGLALALPVAIVSPELAPAAFLGAGVGSVLPDMDVIARHRRTLHYPVYYAVAAGPAAIVAILVASPATVGLALLLVAASLHCWMDAAGGSLELRPWSERSARGVYDHHADEWKAPRRWIRYDGSPGDLAASGVLAVPVLLFVEPPLQWLVVASLIVAIVYASLRKWIAEVAAEMLRRVPVVDESSLADDARER